MPFLKIILLLLLLIGCAAGPPKTFVETQEDTGAWKSIYLHNNYGFFANKNQEVWQRVVDILSEQYDLEVLDRASGYIRTTWKADSKQGKDQYRHRVIIKMQGSVWHTAKLKAESQWWDEQKQIWRIGYDMTVVEEIYKDFQGRLGTAVR